MGMGMGWVRAASWRDQSGLIPQGTAVRVGTAQPSLTPCPLCIPTSCPTSACIPHAAGGMSLRHFGDASMRWSSGQRGEGCHSTGAGEHKMGFLQFTRKTPFPTGRLVQNELQM